MEVIRQARKWKMQYDIKILYIDYVQRLKWTDLKIARHEQVGNVVMCLKELARDLNIPIVALAQVNRDVEKRTDKRPNIGDLANSSEIEKEADCVMLLYRDEAYNDQTMDKGVIEIDVAKNRHGPTGWKKFIWQERFMRVENYLPDGRY
jgi:replicative DNA helicase